MLQDTRSCTCHMPREQLWEFLADYNNVVALGHAEASARLVDGIPQCCDCAYEAQVTWRGSTSHFTACLVDSRRPRTLSWDAETGLGRSRLRFDLEPLDSDRTYVTVTLTHEQSRWAHLLQALAWGFLRKTLDRTHAQLSQLGSDANPGDDMQRGPGAVAEAS